MDPTILRDKAMQVMEPHCYSCHGAEKQKGDVRFDALEAIDPVDLQKLLLDAKAAADGTIETFGPSVLSKDD